jgi:hypothetical protein
VLVSTRPDPDHPGKLFVVVPEPTELLKKITKATSNSTARSHRVKEVAIAALAARQSNDCLQLAATINRDMIDSAFTSALHMAARPDFTAPQHHNLCNMHNTKAVVTQLSSSSGSQPSPPFKFRNSYKNMPQKTPSGQPTSIAVAASLQATTCKRCSQISSWL